MTMISLTTGTAFIMWLGEQITERGIGNGISLIIFAGIVTDMPDARRPHCSQKATDGRHQRVRPVRHRLGIVVAVIAVIIFFERGQRRIPVQYAKRVVGRKMYGGQSTHLPLKINIAGVIPPIFASSILMFPAQIASFVQTPLDAADLARRCSRATGATTSLYVGLDRLLLLLLHGGHLQPGRRRRQPEEVRRLHPGHPAGQARPPSTSTGC